MESGKKKQANKEVKTHNEKQQGRSTKHYTKEFSNFIKSRMRLQKHCTLLHMGEKKKSLFKRDNL